MIEKPTILILGAGASMHLNFPSGKGLKQRILSELEGTNNENFKILLQMGFRTEEINEFRNQLYYSGKGSVDEFLEYRTEFINVGKTAIAKILMDYERINLLFEVQDNWYEYLFQKMNGPFEYFANNCISIITFNYDRSLEMYLFTALKNSYGKDDLAVINQLSTIHIIHVYGQLGNLPWQDSPQREYSPSNNINDINLAASGIKIIHENNAIENSFHDAKNLLAYPENDKIIFLGFGYNKENIKRLSIINRIIGKTDIYGTCFGFLPREQEAIKEYFKPKEILLGRENEMILEFLRRNVTL